MSETQTLTTGRTAFDQMKESNERNYNMFLPGFIIGVIVHRMSKKLFTLEHFAARPWASIFSGLFIGSYLHYYTWKKRMMIEDLCVREELNERKQLDRQLMRLKAGSDLENTITLNYLKNGDKF